VEIRGKIDTHNTHINDRSSLSCHRCINKSGGAKLVLLAQSSAFDEMID
jgi:hypothetical protein